MVKRRINQFFPPFFFSSFFPFKCVNWTEREFWHFDESPRLEILECSLSTVLTTDIKRETYDRKRQITWYLGLLSFCRSGFFCHRSSAMKAVIIRYVHWSMAVVVHVLPRFSFGQAQFTVEKNKTALLALRHTKRGVDTKWRRGKKRQTGLCVAGREGEKRKTTLPSFELFHPIYPLVLMLWPSASFSVIGLGGEILIVQQLVSPPLRLYLSRGGSWRTVEPIRGL